MKNISSKSAHSQAKNLSCLLNLAIETLMGRFVLQSKMVQATLFGIWYAYLFPHVIYLTLIQGLQVEMILDLQNLHQRKI